MATKHVQLFGIVIGIIGVLGASLPNTWGAEACPESLQELEAKEAVLNNWITRYHVLLTKIDDELLKTIAEHRPHPDPNLLQALATASGYRSREYHEAPSYIRVLIDEFESPWAIILGSILDKSAFALRGEFPGAQNFEHRFYWAHCLVEFDRALIFQRMLTREHQKVRDYLTAKKPAGAQGRTDAGPTAVGGYVLVNREGPGEGTFDPRVTIVVAGNSVHYIKTTFDL
jgi:hypothetical protein